MIDVKEAWKKLDAKLFFVKTMSMVHNRRPDFFQSNNASILEDDTYKFTVVDLESFKVLKHLFVEYLSKSYPDEEDYSTRLVHRQTTDGLEISFEVLVCPFENKHEHCGTIVIHLCVEISKVSGCIGELISFYLDHKESDKTI